MPPKSAIFRYLSLSFLIGVFTGSFVIFTNYNLLWLVIVILTVISIFLRRHRVCLILAIIGVFLFGFWRLQNYTQKGSQPLYNLIFQSQHTPDRQVGMEIIGLVDSQIKYTDKSAIFILKAESFNYQGVNYKSRELIYTISDRGQDYRYGDLILIKGNVSVPINTPDFKTKDYLSQSSIFLEVINPKTEILAHGQGSKLMGKLIQVRNWFSDKLSTVIPEPYASFNNGLIFGGSSGLDKNFSSNLKRVGLTHILAVSGYNITILADLLKNIISYLGVSLNLSYWFSGLGIILFVITTGASSSVVRAGVMGLVLIFARKSGRLYQSINAVLIAAIVMVYINPKILKLDFGFQLSFLATLGLIYMCPVWQRILKANQSSIFSWKNNLSTSLSAICFTSPWIWYKQGMVSLISPLANFLIIPLIPYLMFLGLITVLASSLAPILGLPFGFISYLASFCIIKTVNALGNLSFSNISMKIPYPLDLIIVITIYLIIGHIINRENKRLKTDEGQ